MMPMPFFSILLPTRNRAGLLKLTIDSVLRQTYKDFELIVSDNNSSDETSELVKKIAKKDKRVKYFRQNKDLPMGDNWNFCYSKTHGKYYVLMGDDDCLLPDVLKNVYNVAGEHEDADIIGFRYALLKYGQNLLMWSQYNGETIEGSKELFLKRAFGFVTPIEHTLAVSTKLARKVFPRGKPYHGAYLDQGAWFGFFSNARKIYYIEKIGVVLGIAQNSSTVLQKNYRTRKEAFKGCFKLGVKLPLKGDYFANMQYEVLALAKKKDQKFCSLPISMTKYWSRIGSEITMLMLQTMVNLDFGAFKTFVGDLQQFLSKAPKSAVFSALIVLTPWNIVSSVTPLYFREATKDLALKILGLRKNSSFRFTYLKKIGSGYKLEEAAEALQ